MDATLGSNRIARPGKLQEIAMQDTSQTLLRTTLQIALAGALTSASTLGLMPSHAAAVEAHVENAGIFTAQIPVEGSNIATGQAVIVVDKPIEEVLRIVLDYANYVRFMPNFTKSKVLAQRGSRAMVYMEVSVARGMYTLYGQLDLAERPQDGDLARGRRPPHGRKHRRLRCELQAHPDR